MSKLCKCMCYFLPSVSVSIELSPPCFADLATPAAHFPGGWIMLHQICHVLAGFPTRQSALPIETCMRDVDSAQGSPNASCPFAPPRWGLR
eukprot:366573-Chlamydomonas_euryale.AAC.4